MPLTCLLTTWPRYRPRELPDTWSFFREKGKGIERMIVDPYVDQCVKDAKPVLRELAARRLEAK